jgi:hypothetical protein
MGALMHQGTIGESDKVKLLEMGFSRAKTDEVKMLKFFETEATQRASGATFGTCTRMR